MIKIIIIKEKTKEQEMNIYFNFKKIKE